MKYTINILKTDLETLYWLDSRGYAGNFINLAELEREGEVTFTYTMEEHCAWEYRDYIDEDPYAFLTCCGSPTLSRGLMKLLESIV